MTTNKYGTVNQQQQQPSLAKHQPCGCVKCTCEHETQCQGCGAKHCGTHPVGRLPAPVYIQAAEQQPAPDVTALVDALEDCLSFIENDAWPKVYGGAEARKARAALAAYRQGG